MLRNYFKIAFRNLLRHKGVSFINIFGLAIGIACCLLVVLFVRDELSYDKYHRNSGQIYRVVKDFVNDDGSRLPDATTPPALAPALQSGIPEVEKVTRVFPSWGFKALLQYGDKKFMEERIYRVDSSFFDVFTFPFIKGDAKSAFKNPDFILLTESSAHKYFGNADPIGKIIKWENDASLMVAGILKDVPENSHFHFDFIVSIRRFSGNNNIDANWGWYNFYTYVKFKKNTRIAAIEPKIQALYKKNNAEGTNVFYTQRLTGIHLDSNLKWELEPNSDKLYVYVFSIIGLFVIIIACINYINLSTAKSALRAKEIGIRKVAGAFKTSLIKQFLLESVVTVFVSLLVAVLLASLLLPVINQVTEKQLSLWDLGNPGLLATIIGSACIVGLAAGIYPAVYLSSFQPVIVLKGLKVSGKNIFNLRKALVVLQFSISVVLIVGTLIVIRQINFVQNAKLGLNKDQVLIVNNVGSLSRPNREVLEKELLQISGVKKIASSNGVLGGQNWTTGLRLKGSQNDQLINFLSVGYDFLNVLGITIKEGRNFSPDFPADSVSNGVPGTRERQAGGIILNEKAIKDLGIPEPAIGRELVWGTDHDTIWYLKIVGVMKDFHFTSFRSAIKPFAFTVNPNWQDNFTIKVSSDNLKSTISQVEKKWTAFSQDRPFQYSFLDQTFSRLYQAEKRFNQIFLYLTGLAILIACMGLFGLTAFMIEQRTKEIGIRKVIGASVSNIITLLSKDFIKLVVIAFVIACPVAWYFMNKWLQDFVYRIDIDWWVFLVAGVAAIGIALATISFQAIKAAVENPVKSLRTE